MEMGERKYKRRSEFTKEEWKEIIKKALRLRFEYGWGPVRIARELGISPNTVAEWIYRKFPLDYVRDGIFEEDMRSTIRTLKEEREEIERLLAEGKISEEVAKRELEENEACMLEAITFPFSSVVRAYTSHNKLKYLSMVRLSYPTTSLMTRLTAFICTKPPL